VVLGLWVVALMFVASLVLPITQVTIHQHDRVVPTGHSTRH
jgi:hypothetical protein